MGRTVQKQAAEAGLWDQHRQRTDRDLREAGKEEAEKQESDGSVSMEPKAGYTQEDCRVTRGRRVNKCGRKSSYWVWHLKGHL